MAAGHRMAPAAAVHHVRLVAPMAAEHLQETKALEAPEVAMGHRVAPATAVHRVHLVAPAAVVHPEGQAAPTAAVRLAEKARTAVVRRAGKVEVAAAVACHKTRSSPRSWPG